MTQPIEFGLRLRIDTSEGGKLDVVTDGLDGIGVAASKTSQSLNAIASGIEQLNATTGRIAASLGGVADGQRQVAAASQEAAAATARFAETEEQATARIRDMVAASMAAQAAQNSAAAAADKVATSQKTAAQAYNDTAATIRAQNAQMQQTQAVAISQVAAVNTTSASIGALIDRYDKSGAAARRAAADMQVLEKAIQAGKVSDADLLNADEAYKQMAQRMKEGANAADKSAFATAGAKRELMVLGHEAMSGNFSRMPGSFMVLAERMDLTNVLMSPMTMGLVGIGVAAAAVGVEIYKGSVELDHFNKSMILTGGYAGMTRSALDATAQSITTDLSGGLIKSRELLEGLAATGRFSAVELAAVGQAAIDFQHLSGESADKVIKQFEGMTEGTIAWVKKTNDQYHFLNVVQYEHIRQLVEQGEKEQAVIEISAALHKSIDTSHEKVSAVKIPFIGWAMAVDRVKDSLMNLGKGQSAADAVSESIAKEAALRAKLAAQRALPGGMTGQLEEQLKAQHQKTVQLITVANNEENAAYQKGEDARVQQAAVAAAVEMDALKKTLRSKEQIRMDEADKIRRNAEAVNAGAVAAGKAPVYDDDKILELIQASEKKHKDKVDNSYANDYKRLTEAIEKYIPQLEAERVGTAALTEGQKLALDVKRKLTQADQAALGPAMARIQAGELALAEHKAMIAAGNEAYKAEQQRADAMEKSAVAINADAEKIRDHTQELGLSKSAIDDLKASRANDQIALQEHQLAEIDATGQCTAYSEALRDNIAALKGRQAALRDESIKQARVDEAKSATEAWKKTGQEINRSLTDNIMRGGKNGGKYVEDYFRTLVLRPVISAVMQPVAGMAATVIGQTIGSMGSTGSDGTNILNAGSGMYNAYGAASGAGIYGSIAGSAAGQAIGLSSTASFVGPPVSASMLPGAATAAGEVGLTTIGTAVPYIAAALIAAQALGLFDKDVENPQFTPVYGNQTGLPGLTKKGNFGNYGFAQAPTDSAGLEFAKQFNQFNQSVDNTGASLLGWDATRMGRVTDRLTGVTQRSDGQPLQWAFPKLDKGSSQEVTTEVAKTVLGSVLDEVGKGLGDVVRAMGPQAVTDVLAFAGAVKDSQLLFSSVGQSATGLNKDLVDAMGGADDFASGIKSLSGLFVTAGEKTASQMGDWRAQVASGFADIGMAIPKDVAGFKEAVAGLDLTTDAGKQTFAALAKLEPAWESLQKGSETIRSNAITAWQGYQSATGNNPAAMAASAGMASTTSDKAMGTLATTLGVNGGTLDAAIAKSGGLANAAVAYWDKMDDAQKIAVTDALTAKTAYINVVKSQWDAQYQIVQTAYNNVKKFSDFGSTLASDIAGIQIAAGTLDQGTYLRGQIAEQQAALTTLYAGGASPDELLATAGKIRDLTLQENDLKISGIKEVMQFSVQVGDYLKTLKIGDLSPLTMGQKLSEAGAQLNDVLLTLESGTEEQKSAARAKLTGNADAYLKLAQQYDPSTYAKVFAEVQTALTPYADTGTVAEQQLAEQQAIAAKAQGAIDQLQALKAQSGVWQAAAQGKLDTAVTELAPISAKLDQLGAGGAIETAIRDLPKALSTIIASGTPSSATGSATVNFSTGQVALGGKYAGTVVSTADIRSGVAGAVAAGTDPKAIYNQFKDSGMTMPQVDLVMGWEAGSIENWAKASGLPFFETGVERIKKSGPAFLHEDEGVLNRNDNRMLDILNGVVKSGAIGGSDPAMLGLLGDLVREVKELRADYSRLSGLVAEAHARSNEDAAGQVVEAIKAKQQTGRTQEALL